MNFLTRPLSWPRRTPLRVRLVASLLVLVATALFLISLVGVMALRTYQVERVDAQLLGTATTLANRAANGGAVVDPDQSIPLPLPGSFLIVLSDEDGNTLGALRSVNDVQVLPRMQFDGDDVKRLDSLPFDVHASDSTRWRAVALPVVVDGVNQSLVVAVSLSDVDSTTSRLVAVNTAVSLGALVVLGWVGSIIVRSNLTPLRDVEQTAGMIANGDLSRRVPDQDPRTEIGSLSRSLNTMLARLESAFADRSQALEEARVSEDRMRRFIADASHELRTPLTSIRGFAELGRVGAVPPEESPELLERIEEEASRMGLLVEDLLTLARLDRERVAPVEDIDVLAVALDVLDAAQAAYPDRTVELLYESSPHLPGDPARLHQVLSNLVTNALKYTTGTVEVELGEEPAEVWLEVRDQGPGLSENDAKHVFERFYRADSSRTRATGGTGLGLSIVDSLVRSRGGTVQLTTSPTAGSRFRVTLPQELPTSA